MIPNFSWISLTSGARLRRQEGAGGLADVVDAGGRPRDLLSRPRARDRDEAAVDQQPRGLDRDAIDHLAGAHRGAVARELAVHGVVCQQVGHVLGVHGRVDVAQRHRLSPREGDDAHDLTPDPAKAVDADARLRGPLHAGDALLRRVKSESLTGVMSKSVFSRARTRQRDGLACTLQLGLDEHLRPDVPTPHIIGPDDVVL